ncbi:MAG: HD domain-containing protein [Chloroflexi bacterium]|nr:HD domain-containing protein [Chloroflexota bacterium]
MNSRTPPDLTGSSTLRETLPLLHVLRDFFSSREVTAYLVGGFLRDAFLGRPTRDIDLAVNGDVLSLAKELAEHTGGTFVLLDETRSIARVVLSSELGDVWSLKRKQVDMGPFGGDITKDMARRDFTIDALALSLDDALDEALGSGGGISKIVDPFDGFSDLSAATVRAVSDHAFQDDPVRLLRAVRLVAQLGFSLDQGTIDLIKRDSHLLTNVASERLRDELLKTLAEPDPSPHLRLMDDLGLLCRLIPELEVARGVEQPREHYWDVFYHCLETPSHVDRLMTEEDRAGDDIISYSPWYTSLETYFEEEVSDGHTRRTIVKLAGLLHDVSKPATKTIEDTGRMRFIGHDVQGADVCQEILRRLRLSSRGIHLITTMVRHHLRPTQMSHGDDMPTPRATYRYFRDLGEAAIDTLYLNMADYLAAKGPSIETDDWQGHCRLIDHILHRGLDQEGMPQKMPRLVDGHMLMKALGLPPGAQVGRLLEAIQEALGAGEITTQEEALHLARRLVAAG